MMYCFSIGLYTEVAKTPLQPFCIPQAYKQMILGYFSDLRLSLLVPNAEDNSPPGDLTIIFSKLLFSCMRPCQVMKNWLSMCLKCQVLFTAEVGKLITPDCY